MILDTIINFFVKRRNKQYLLDHVELQEKKILEMQIQREQDHWRDIQLSHDIKQKRKYIDKVNKLIEKKYK